MWERISPSDYVFFYAIRPVGVVRRKFREDKVLWPREVEEGRVIWPNRFVFEVKVCLPEDK